MSRLTRRDLMRGALLAPMGAMGVPGLAAAVQQASSPYARPKLKITDVRTAEVSAYGYQPHVGIYANYLRQADADWIDHGVTAFAFCSCVALLHDLHARQTDEQLAQLLGNFRWDLHVTTQERLTQPITA